MRICLLAHAGSIHTRRWARWFARAGHEVHVVSLTVAEGEELYRVHVLGNRNTVHQARTNWSYLRLLPALRRRIREIRPDIVNAHFLTSNGLFGALVRPRGVPFVISVHGSDVLTIPRRSPWMRPPLRWALGAADLVTAVSSQTAEAVRDLAGARIPLESLQYGVDRSIFTPGLPADERPPIVLSTRRLEEFARIDLLLEAAALLERSGSPLEVVVAGEGGLTSSLEEKARGLRRVRFIGNLSETDVAKHLRESALYVSLSRSDGASLSLLEAMASGAYPIVSDIPANREWIASGRNGAVVDDLSAAGIAEVLERGWCDTEARECAARENVRMVAERADREVNMARIEDLFLRLVRDSARGA
ncbi:MAG: glycosyltransferase family 4 protein [bacterium]